MSFKSSIHAAGNELCSTMFSCKFGDDELEKILQREAPLIKIKPAATGVDTIGQYLAKVQLNTPPVEPDNN
jgi:hypothetical protein